MKRFWQWLGFHIHDWSKWTETMAKRTPLDQGLPRLDLVTEVIAQERECKTCGFKEIRTL